MLARQISSKFPGQPFVRPEWAQLTGVSPEVAAIVMGVTAGQAEMKQREARRGQTRAARLAEAVADFGRSQMGRDTPTGPLFKLIRNQALHGEAGP